MQLKRYLFIFETYSVLEYLSPVSHQHESDGRSQHDDQEWPVELAVQRSGYGEESKHDQDDNIGDQVGQHLESKQSVHLEEIQQHERRSVMNNVTNLLTDMMQITMDTA